MKYRRKYKYQLAKDEKFVTGFRPSEDIITTRIQLRTSGVMIVCEGYAWDGPSGPVVDRKTNLRPSCGHDALYQLMRTGKLDYNLWKTADSDFGVWLREDGAWSIIVATDLLGLRLAGGAAALPKNRKRVFSAP